MQSRKLSLLASIATLSGIADHVGTSAAHCCQLSMYKRFCRALSTAADVVAPWCYACHAQAEPLSGQDSAAVEARGWPNYSGCAAGQFGS